MACRERDLLVITRSLVFILEAMVLFVGAVSPSIFRTVPKCFEYGASSRGWCGAVVLRVCVSIVASIGHCRSKFQAKLLNIRIGVLVGALCILTWNLLLLRPNLTTSDKSPAQSM